MSVSTSSSTAPPAPPVELSPGRLYALGGALPLDGDLSWAPHLPGRFQFVNAYLLLEGDRGLLVDTGVAIHRDAVLEQLEQVVPEGAKLTVFLTRAEMDCLSNLAAIASRFHVEGAMTGGSMNPFDAFDDVPWVGPPGAHFGIEQTDRGGLSMVRTKQLQVGEGRPLVVLTPVFRLLSTFWLFDDATKTLFTSDLFGHSDSSPLLERSIDALEHDETTLESAAQHLFSKFWWLPRARTQRLRDDLNAIFDEFEPEAIAPTRGRMLRGRDVVERHRAIVDEILSRPGDFV